MSKVFSLLVLACIAAGVALSQMSAKEPPSPPPAASVDDKFIVHEWGTFTTFSGSDGVFLDFRPLEANGDDLPSYVLDRGSFSSNVLRFLSKRQLRGRVRMETPVTYFYTDRHRTVDVRVDFPEGLLTEFYPPVREVLPPIDEVNIFTAGERLGKSSLNWGSVDLIPFSELVPNLKDTNLRESVSKSIVNGLLPHSANEQHYAAARETDSALVHYREKADGPSYFEKFLFYRGVGKFQLPITVQFEGNQTVLRNSGAQPITSAILIDVRDEKIQAMQISNIQAGQSVPFGQLRPVDSDQLAKMVRECLVAEGLYEKEAASMVATWQLSWFTENGMRVLYPVPKTTTEKLLPLHIKPAPQECLRVLIGRMEIMSPSSEQQMIEAVAQSIAARAEHHKQQSGSQTPYVVPNQIQAFGRLAEPALARVARIAKEQAIRNEAEILIGEFQNTNNRVD